MEIDTSYLQYIRTKCAHLSIPKDEMDKFESYLTVQTVKKNEYLIREGDIPSTISFVISGLFRAFYLTSDGEEKTIVFRGKGRVLSSYSSYIKNVNSQFSIEALEESVVFSITIKDFEDLLHHNTC